ncbi:hypothetical protein BH09ACT4_BH09ACT4_09350 [soil metagenome]
MSNPAGTWNFTVATPFGDQTLVVELAVDGDKVSGTATHDSGMFPLTDGSYRDGKVVFELSLTTPVTADLKVTLKADGDTMSGKAKAGLLSFKMTGTRASSL